MAAAGDGWVTSPTGLFAMRVIYPSGAAFLCTTLPDKQGFAVAVRDGDEFFVEVRPMARDQYPGLGFVLKVDGRRTGKWWYSTDNDVLLWEGFYENKLFSSVRPFVVSTGSVQQEEEDSQGTERVGTIVVKASKAREKGTFTVTDTEKDNYIGEDAVVPHNESKKFFKQASLSTQAGASRPVDPLTARKVGDVIGRRKTYGPVLDEIAFIYDQESHLRLRGLRFPGDEVKRPSPTHNKEDEPDEKKPKVV